MLRTFNLFLILLKFNVSENLCFFVLLVNQLELEMAINTMSPNYCRSKGEQIALNVDGTSYDETNTYRAYVRG